MNNVLIHPLAHRALWMTFAVLFYYSGLSFTTWLLEPENLARIMDGVGATLFPALLPTFFVVNSRLGCANGHCAAGPCSHAEQPGHTSDRMPGI